MQLSKGQQEELTHLRWSAQAPVAGDGSYEYLHNEVLGWGEFSAEAIQQYFTFTSTGRRPDKPHPDYGRMITAHSAVTLQITSWKEDIARRYIFKSEIVNSDCPRSLLAKVLDVPVPPPEQWEVDALRWIHRERRAPAR